MQQTTIEQLFETVRNGVIKALKEDSNQDFYWNNLATISQKYLPLSKLYVVSQACPQEAQKFDESFPYCIKAKDIKTLTTLRTSLATIKQKAQAYAKQQRNPSMVEEANNLQRLLDAMNGVALSGYIQENKSKDMKKAQLTEAVRKAVINALKESTDAPKPYPEPYDNCSLRPNKYDAESEVPDDYEENYCDDEGPSYDLDESTAFYRDDTSLKQGRIKKAFDNWDNRKAAQKQLDNKVMDFQINQHYGSKESPDEDVKNYLNKIRAHREKTPYTNKVKEYQNSPEYREKAQGQLTAEDNEIKQQLQSINEDTIEQYIYYCFFEDNRVDDLSITEKHISENDYSEVCLCVMFTGYTEDDDINIFDSEYSDDYLNVDDEGNISGCVCITLGDLEDMDTSTSGAAKAEYDQEDMMYGHDDSMDLFEGENKIVNLVAEAVKRTLNELSPDLLYRAADEASKKR